jgi:hypothetical protein
VPRVSKGPWDRKVPPAPEAKRERRVLRARSDRRGLRVKPEDKVPRDQQANEATLGRKGRRDHLGLPERLALRASPTPPRAYEL